MDYEKIAQQILQLVGNKQNIISVNHCFTRLRFQLKDNNKANREKLLQTEGVISVVESSGQYQVVLGNKVTKIYDALLPLIGEINSIKQEQPKVSIGIKILNNFAAIFTPIIPAIAASGMLKGILAIAFIIGKYYSTDIKNYNTYIILYAASDAVFYFMPIILGYTAAKVFKAHEFISMIIGATLCYPSVVSLMTSKSEVTFFAIELTKANYTSSVIPI
ncbi:MAG: PTS transporter subunit EIIB, partial [Gilliamella apicola]|nr:PTS transporter subunit EIIB [Gilliamella apicola]